jgi:hypothetical protein
MRTGVGLCGFIIALGGIGGFIFRNLENHSRLTEVHIVPFTSFETRILI